MLHTGVRAASGRWGVPCAIPAYPAITPLTLYAILSLPLCIKYRRSLPFGRGRTLFWSWATSSYFWRPKQRAGAMADERARAVAVCACAARCFLEKMGRSPCDFFLSHLHFM
eukprot:5859988-Prymnesium_polylepis.1